MATKKYISLFLISVFFMSNSTLSTKLYTDTQEYALKAAFIYRFVDYVEWENNHKSETFDIAVLSQSPITGMLTEIAASNKAKSKKINIKKYDDLNDIGFCNILFVSKNYINSIEAVIAKFSNQNVLIITENAGYGLKGAHINFLISENKLKFEVNLKAVKLTGLKMSSQLLEHAIIITP